MSVVLILCWVAYWGTSFHRKSDYPLSQKLCFRNLLIAIPQSKALCHRWQKPFLMTAWLVPLAYILLFLLYYLWVLTKNVNLNLFSCNSDNSRQCSDNTCIVLHVLLLCMYMYIYIVYLYNIIYLYGYNIQLKGWRFNAFQIRDRMNC